MKRIALFSLVALMAALVAACGSPAPSAEVSSQSGPAAITTVQAPAGGTEVDVTLADNTITSSLTSFKAGVPYTFVVKNTGRHEHNFNIAPPISVSGNLDASLAQALLTMDQHDLPVGGSKTATYTFPASAVGTPLEFSCLIPRHYEDGMRLKITVTN